MSESSGDLLADRRYQWGVHALKRKDFAAAADLFRQVLERAGTWAPAHLALGDALAGLGDADAAQSAWRKTMRLDPAGKLGAQLRLAAQGAAPTPPHPPRAYIRALFDEYAPRFDAHLREKLSYRGPELLMDALERACNRVGREFYFDRALDLGCGTGLMGAHLWSRVDSMNGCDLSPKMIDAALRCGKYSTLRVADALDYLIANIDGGADLVAAADVFIYLGDLGPLFAQCARVIAPGGLLAFTVQLSEGADWAIGADLRYAHSRAYVERLAGAHGFAIAALEEAWARKEADREVPGLVAVLARA